MLRQGNFLELEVQLRALEEALGLPDRPLQNSHTQGSSTASSLILTHRQAVACLPHTDQPKPKGL